jgi:amino acid adenylation domain-containing protein
MSSTSERIAGLSPEKLAQLAERLRGRNASAAAGQRIPRRAAGGPPPPLSFAQQRLWFLDQLEPGSAAYNIPVAVRLEGRLDAAALERSLREIVRRHESLRTTFADSGGRPAQIVSPEAGLNFRVGSLEDLPAGEREDEARRLALEEARKPFDLARGPLLRATLVRLQGEAHLALFTLHHIVSDGWSHGVLIRELAALYAAYVAGRPSPLEELPIQYADYALWQRERLSGEGFEGQLAYWRERLRDAPALELPADRPRPPAQSFRGKTLPFTLEPGLSDAIRELSRREGVTLYMTLLAAFQTVLSRHAGQEDFVVGTPVAGRQRVETEGLIGFFVNTLALRADLSGDPTFRELLGRVRETTLSAFAHQDVPFEKLVEELQPERELSRTPLFQVLFGLQNAPRESLELPGLRLTTVPNVNETAKFDLTLLMHETPRGLAGVLNYAADLFDGATAARLLGHFENLLRGVARDHNRKLSALPLLTDAERRQLLEDFNDTRRDYPSARCIHELFEAQAARTPDATALVHERERLTYADLNARANHLARRLRALGVGAESRVGVLLGRAPDLVAALLGVLKAGGAYVPLDPDYPRERLRFMLEDSAVSALVTQTSLLGHLPACDAPALCVDDGSIFVVGEREVSSAVNAAGDSAASEPRPAVSHARAAAPDNLAYVIYTSGSTGRPKGVAIEHASAHTFLRWAHETFTREELAGVLASTSVCFDLSVFELFAPLTRGGSVILAQNALALPALPAASDVTLVNTVPSAMAELVRSGGVPDSVLAVNLAGEPLKRALAEGVYGRTKAGRVLNLYGPSEDTTYSTYTVVGHGEEGEPTIGRPVANTRAYLLDRHLSVVPRGTVGELFLGGDGLARGYLNRPSLTAERFVPDPFSGERGARLYRTGDLARYRPDGELEFLGRADHQVKVRGFRIELGEIEAALLAQEGVRACVVVALEDEPGEKRVVAYVAAGADAVADGEAAGDGSAARGSVSAASLRARLRERLPEYMVPSAFVFLDGLPLTPNGKVDRKALPAPEASGSDVENYVAPRNEVEEMLCGMWAEVLKAERVGVEDNFFELGGHSLLATRLTSRVREAFGVELPLRRLFERPTVAGLARAIGEEKFGGSGTRARAIRRAERESAPPLSFAQQRFWFLDQLGQGNSLYNVTLAVRLTGGLDTAALEDALREVARRHESLRTTFAAVDARPVQVISSDARVELGMTDFSGLGEHERERAARSFVAEEAARPFELSRGPLWRARLARLGAREHVLCVVMHHIITDGWSMGVFVGETAALYEARVGGGRAFLPELPIQYADYALWQRERLEGGELERQTEYWRAELAGAPSVLDLPTDRPRPAAQTFRGRAHSFELSHELHARLKGLSRREGVTLFMTLLAGFEVLLARHSGQEDFVVGAGVAGRNAVELEGLIGCFVNFLALRSRVAAAPTVRGLLRAVREQTLAAHANQDIPFEVLLERLQPERRPGYPPLFQVTFFYQNVPRPAVETPGLKIEPLAAPPSVAKFDLMLVMDERGDRLGGLFEYNTDLFDASAVERLAAHFTNLLWEMAADPDREVSELALADEAATRRLSDAFGGELE